MTKNLRKYLDESTEADRALWEIVNAQLKVQIPNRAVCEHHDAPFTFISDLFFERTNTAVVLANRTGGKTLGTAVLNYLDLKYKAVEIAVVAGSLSQAKRGYNYTKKFWPDCGEDLLDGPPLMSETKLKNGGKLEVLAASEHSVHAPHCPKLRMDEVELMKPEIYEGALSIPISQNGIPASILKTSTRFRIYGQMNKVLNRAEASGDPVYKWCVWEIAEQCTKTTCVKCILSDYCEGKARRSRGYMPIRDIEQKFKEMDEDTWLSQWLCLKPSRTGLVYQEFNEDVHVVDFTPDGKEYGTIDWGYTNPFVYLKIITTPDDRVWIDDELYLYQTAVSDCIGHVKERGFAPIEAHADPSGSTEIAEFRKAGFTMVAKGGKVEDSIPTVRALLKPRDDGNGPSLYVNRRCVNFIREFGSGYHYIEGTDKPAKEDDHGPDALRYFVRNKYGGKRHDGFTDYAREVSENGTNGPSVREDLINLLRQQGQG